MRKPGRAVEFRSRDPFMPLVPNPGLFHACHDHSTLVRAWSGDSLALEPDGTHFLVALEGSSSVATAKGHFPLMEGMYAAVLDGSVGGLGKGLVVSRRDFF